MVHADFKLSAVLSGASYLFYLSLQTVGHVWVSQERKYINSHPTAMTGRLLQREFKSWALNFSLLSLWRYVS